MATYSDLARFPPAGQDAGLPRLSLTGEWRRDGALRLLWLDRRLKHHNAFASTGRGKPVEMIGTITRTPHPIDGGDSEARADSRARS